MTYGMLAPGSCLLTDIVDQLHEDSKKVNSVERLTRHLNKGAPKKALNSYLSICMAFLAHISMKPETSVLKVSIIEKAEPIKEKVHFCYYRLAKGIPGILSYAKEGVRFWFRTKRPTYRQLRLKLTA